MAEAQLIGAMLELEEAQQRILSLIKPLPTEVLPLQIAGGRFLAEEVTAGIDLPLFDNSAMDGYAVRAQDLAGADAANPVALRLLGRVPAGQAFTGEVGAGTCVRLFTGSPLPKGADAVVMQEDTRVQDSERGTIQFLDAVKPGENVRLKGEDIKTGAPLAGAGQRLTAGRISLLGATGCGEVRVSRQPVIGLIATGSELREAGQTLAAGQIYESNRAGLAVLVSQAGAKPKIFPIVQDDLAATRSCLEAALSECDAVATSGGVSVGEFDFVKTAFEQLGGDLTFWKVALKPGKPFAFGQWREKVLFGLPGNPVSALVTFLLLVRPALLRMQGAVDLKPVSHPGGLEEPLINRGDRRHFMRVTVDHSGRVRLAGTQGSHVLSSLAHASGLVDVPPNSVLEAGRSVSVLRFD